MRFTSGCPNTVGEPPRLDIVRRIGRRFAEPLVAILLVAAVISGATGDLGSFAIIVTVVVLSIGLDLFQEHRAERAADALKRSVAIHADVRRDSVVITTSVDQLVPGDVVELRAGDLVPADGIDLFRTAWFVESIATQILVIFVIRTHGPAWMSRPHPALIASSLAALGAALILVVSPLAPSLGFDPMPGGLAITIVIIVLTYLGCAEIAKRFADSPPG